MGKGSWIRGRMVCKKRRGVYTNYILLSSMIKWSISSNYTNCRQIDSLMLLKTSLGVWFTIVKKFNCITLSVSFCEHPLFCLEMEKPLTIKNKGIKKFHQNWFCRFLLKISLVSPLQYTIYRNPDSQRCGKHWFWILQRIKYKLKIDFN